MLDIKLKKINKKKIFVIALCILLPALFLVALYPRMETAMIEFYEQRKAQLDEERKNNVFYQMELDDRFVNYAIEASYYLYGRLYQEKHGAQVNFGALDEYGWVNDYYYINDYTHFYAEYDADGEETFCQNIENPILKKLLTTPEKVKTEQLYQNGMVGYLTLAYDQYGHIDSIDFQGMPGLLYNERLYESATQSMEQYQINAGAYYDNHMYGNERESDGIAIETSPNTETVDNSSLNSKEEFIKWRPKNFKAVFALYEESAFVWDCPPAEHYIGSYADMYLEIGAWIIIVLFAIWIIGAALILPFFKQLETGWEKLFSIPAECIVCLAVAVCVGFFLMFEAMSTTTIKNITDIINYHGDVKFLGYTLSVQGCYGCLLIVNVIGWAIVFFMEYIVAASFRQFLCGPVYYFKNRFLTVRLFQWIGKKCQKIYHSIISIDIRDHLTQSILKIVAANFVILTILCCMWVFGLAGLIVYSVALYIILQKQGGKIKEQFQKILEALKQIADGNLKIQIEEDLGIFSPLGKELSKVQEGFSKAVQEEAKSQNMKTELITNVSHDLKTPLTAIITYVDLLKQEGITQEARDSYIATLDQKSQRLKVLIEDLFEVSKANSGTIKMNYMEVDIVSLMKQVRSEMAEQMENSNISFRWNLPDEKVTLLLDGQRTYRIFENLITNILKYSMPYSRAYIDIIAEEQKVQLMFRNMSASELNFDVNRLTDRFVRGDASRNTEGSGLGLAIAKSFTELQKGTFQIEVDGDLFKVKISWMR